ARQPPRRPAPASRPVPARRKPRDPPDLPGAPRRRPPLDLARLRRLPRARRPLRLRDLDVELPDPRVRGRPADAALLDLPRRGRVPALVPRRHRDRDGGRVAAGARRRQLRRPSVHGAERAAGVLHGAARPVLPRLAAALVPDPARVRQRPLTRLRLGVPVQHVAARRAADPRRRPRLQRRLGSEHAHGDDQHDRRGLRRDGPREGPARPPRDDAVRGPERDPAAAERLRRPVRERGRRPRLRRVRLQLSGRRPDAAAGRARSRLPARPGDPRRALGLGDRRQPDHGPAEPRPRPTPADGLMSQLEPAALDLPVVAPPRVRTRRRLHLPGWLLLLFRNPKSRFGLLLVGAIVLVALISPLISVSDPNAFSITDARQAPSWHHLFGTTDQGSDIFSQVVVGARRSLLLGAAAGALATALAAILGITAAYCGGLVDEAVNVLINVFLTIPPIPLLIVVSGYLSSRGMWTMVLVLALVLWAFEARILRGQTLLLKNRDFVQAAKVSGESTMRIVFGELMPNMISRIAAAFVLVFYIALLT